MGGVETLGVARLMGSVVEFGRMPFFGKLYPLNALPNSWPLLDLAAIAQDFRTAGLTDYLQQWCVLSDAGLLLFLDC